MRLRDLAQRVVTVYTDTASWTVMTPPPRPDGSEPAQHAPVEWITVQAAAVMLELTEARIHHLMSEGWLLGRKDGTRRLVLHESVAEELRRRTPPYPAHPYPRSARHAG